jgi:hypothetical protein
MFGRHAACRHLLDFCLCHAFHRASATGENLQIQKLFVFNRGHKVSRGPAMASASLWAISRYWPKLRVNSVAGTGGCSTEMLIACHRRF